MDQQQIGAFLEAYAAAFARSDATAVADLFAYPCAITGDAGKVSVTVIPSRAAWLPQLEKLAAAYRSLDVRSAEMVEVQAVELSTRLAQATVHWRLLGGDGGTIYEFDASYTLADFGEGPRITAIAHNETARLRAARR